MMRKSIFSIVTVVLLVAYAAWRTPESVAEPIASTSEASGVTAQSPEMTEAVALFKKGEYDGALKRLREAVKKDPNLLPPQVLMAQLFSQVGSAAGVRNALEQAVVETPGDPRPYAVIADIAMRERRFTESRLLYEKADGLMAKWKGSEKARTALQREVYGGLAASAEARNDWTEAKRYLEEWLRLEPKSSTALQRIALCLYRQKNEQGALEKLREAVKFDDDMLLPETMLAQFCARTGDQDGAKKWFVAALTAAPRDVKSRLVAAQWAWETRKLEDAKKQAEAALQLDPKSMDAKILCGIVALFMKDYPKAEMYFEQAHLQSPKDFRATNNLVLALIEQKDDAKRQNALDYAEANVRQYPKLADAYSTYGWVLYKLGRLEDAENALRTAISGGTFSAETAYYFARVLADRGRYTDARQLLESALKSPGPFAQREEAAALLEKLKK